MNTQIINLIPPIDGVQYGYNSDEIKEGDFYYLESVTTKNMILKASESKISSNCKKILFSNNPKDTRFPYLQLPSKEQVVDLSFAIWYSGMEKAKVQSAYKRFVKETGYTNPAKYTQEQMKQALIMAKEVEREGNKNLAKYGILEILEHFETAKAVRVEMIDNGYEVDMEGRGGMELGETCWFSKMEIKVETSSEFSQGIVRAIEVIY